VDYYTFVVTEYHILVTRAGFDTDALYLSHSVHVDGTLVASDFAYLGQFDEGTTQQPGNVGIPAVVINDPSAKVDFVFQLVNAGNPSIGTVDAAMLGTAEQLIGIGAGSGSGESLVSGLLSAIPADGVWALVLKGAAKLWDWLNTDCDGPVAVDRLSGARFAIDTWADDDPTGTISVIGKRYTGLDPQSGCGPNSEYAVTWFVQHFRGWGRVIDPQKQTLESATSVAVAAHNGSLHVFGAAPGFGVTHARTFSGNDWQVSLLDTFGRSDFFHVNPLPPSAISFNDRLHLFCVLDDGSIWPLAHTADGGSWATSGPRPPTGLTTSQPIATVEFGHRLHVFARDSATSLLRFTSSSDLLTWSPWQNVPAAGLSPGSAVAAAALGDRLFLFGIYDTGKPPESEVIVVTSTADTVTWTPWTLVEAGARPEDRPATDQPLDVAATQFGGRLYIASRWIGPTSGPDAGPYVALNFSGDGSNWSGWRVPTASEPFNPSTAPAVAASGNHVYLLAPAMDSAGSAVVCAY
jgi:hypothetical protein